MLYEKRLIVICFSIYIVTSVNSCKKSLTPIALSINKMKTLLSMNENGYY